MTVDSPKLESIGRHPPSVICRFFLLNCKDLGAEEQACDASAEQGSGPEEPELLHRLAADEDRGTQAAGRVHAGAGDVDAEQVNGDNVRPITSPANPLGAAFWVEPRITMRNRKVASNS